jgi:hypothetical protein
MTVPGEQHRNQQIGENGASAAQAAEQIAISHGQTRELRERTAELVTDLRAYVGYELGRRVRMGQMDPEDLLRDEVIDSVFAAAMTRLGQGQPIRDLRVYMRNRAQETIQRESRRIQNERRQFVSLERGGYGRRRDPRPERPRAGGHRRQQRDAPVPDRCARRCS